MANVRRRVDGFSSSPVRNIVRMTVYKAPTQDPHDATTINYIVLCVCVRQKPAQLSAANSDIQSDMARNQYEDSISDGGSGGYRDENDDEEYSMNVGSGDDGSGYGKPRARQQRCAACEILIHTLYTFSQFAGNSTPDILNPENRDNNNASEASTPSAAGATNANAAATTTLLSAALLLLVCALHH